MTLAAPVLAATARTALTAGQEHLDGDPLALLDAPSLEGALARADDGADDFVAGDEWPPREQLAAVLLVVGAAKPARLDPQDARVRARVGDVEVSQRQPAGRVEDERPGGRQRDPLSAWSTGRTSDANVRRLRSASSNGSPE